ncbi:similar to Saccharomyces cerevisiae YKL189W HYM1 Component of the RAM signaling network that is involved in regulation of Ace2p activity and cellular morphogenesis [Maudiozyma saulgeensis]|uniref:Similar to Saccharomyces cerevisiae YKL189W HYM1 Component of the RAM signaling network that is involved in regulation of Ace2p activity and cellular morphogenesis n=1 Tax=Maudiozyma saulgeensis TaxID=1789683 RepID=A0A1X7QZ70_9SACH|nr:similar to Saccharomyces cerevisiae YKL189W HYM1 Component of the RAM signaling network that is involved in regulation of Ace2p activity and cellular morphogenesis [Kazachstania saulgeensis]
MFKKYKNQDLDMAFWWKKNPKTSSDYVKLVEEQLSKISSSTSADSKKKVQEECSKYLMGLKHFIIGDTDPKPTPEALDELYLAILRADLFYDLIIHFNDLEFEARKEVALIFSICLGYSKDNKFVTVDYLVSQPRTITLMLRSIELALQNKGPSQDIFLVLGNMIIECIKYEQLCRVVLKDQQLWKFFEFARLPNFEISTESLQILNNVFTTHSNLVSKEFFCNEYNRTKFIRYINKLMAYGNYVTKRQSTKLLASLIVIRSNNQLMNQYIDSADNLKLIMTLMTDKSKNLQLESFNVFKVIVANPRKTKPVFDILTKNRTKLLKYFETFGLDNQDNTFVDERDFIIRQIEGLPRIVSSNEGNSPSGNTGDSSIISTSPISDSTSGNIMTRSNPGSV